MFTLNYSIQHELNILFSNIFILVIFGALGNNILAILNLIPHYCLIDKLLGIPCPVCGMTRAFCEISNWNLISASTLNFASFFVASYFLLQIPLRIATIASKRLRSKTNKISRTASNILLIIVLANWVLSLFIQRYTSC